MSNSNIFFAHQYAMEIVPRDASVIAVIRHGEKTPQIPGQDPDFRMLTEKGKSEACDLGVLLRGRIDKISHSTLGRCRQTAECMANGANIGSYETICELAHGMLVSDRVAMRGSSKKMGFPGMIDAVIAGHEIPGFLPMMPNLANLVAATFLRADRDINMNISHDWIVHMLAVSCGAINGTFSKSKVGYLEGIYLWQQHAKLLFYYKGRQGVCNDDFVRAVVTGGGL